MKNHSAKKNKSCYTKVPTRIKIGRVGPRKTVKVRHFFYISKVPFLNPSLNSTKDSSFTVFATASL